jgi:Amino acid permease
MADRIAETQQFIPLAAVDHGDELSVSDRDSFDLDGQTHRPPLGSLTRLNGLALVISLQIGSGIFTAPSQVSQFVTTPGYGLLVWLLGGALVWTGAASFIELGLRIPNNGGIQEYLRTSFGDFMGFLFTWSWVVIAKPSANAIIATIFADYLTHAFAGEHIESGWILKAVGVLCIATVTFVNCLGATAGAKAANLFLILKLGALSSIVVIGGIVWMFGYGEGVPLSESGWLGWTPEQDELDAWTWIGNFVTALFGALFCYGGWETVGHVPLWHFYLMTNSCTGRLCYGRHGEPRRRSALCHQRCDGHRHWRLLADEHCLVHLPAHGRHPNEQHRCVGEAYPLPRRTRFKTLG